ncbi:hypothetical protein HanRHA438_Chr04g0189311 [Helianthus annuus]|nr:hypothetical protein HanRHA438_Chr04g0189311 [Helianthus annuus]
MNVQRTSYQHLLSRGRICNPLSTKHNYKEIAMEYLLNTKLICNFNLQASENSRKILDHVVHFYDQLLEEQQQHRDDSTNCLPNRP